MKTNLYDFSVTALDAGPVLVKSIGDKTMAKNFR